MITRVTNRGTNRNYLLNLNKNNLRLNKTSESIYTGRALNRFSENPADAVKAYRTRTNTSDNISFQKNCESALERLQFAEDQLMQFDDVYKESKVKIIKALSDTNTDQRGIIATEIKTNLDNMLKILNTQFGEKFLFGGGNTYDLPYTVDDDGNLEYHGNTNPLNLDVGLGLTYTQDGDSFEMTSVFDVALSGEFIFGEALDASSENLFNSLAQIANLLDEPLDDPDQVEANINEVRVIYDKLEEQRSSVLKAITNIGSNTNYLQTNLERLRTHEDALVARTTKLEGVDYERAITDLSADEMTWRASLQIGQKIIQPSLLDFLQ